MRSSRAASSTGGAGPSLPTRRPASHLNLPFSRTAVVSIDVLTGLAFFMYWVVVRPTTEISVTQTQWPYVVWFSATILTLALAVPLLGRMIGGKWILRLARLAGAAAVLASAANIIEDGFDQGWAFLVFSIGAGGILISNFALAAVLVFTRRGVRRGLAFIPFGTAVSILAFVAVGGPLMFVTWLAAAAIVVWWKTDWTGAASRSDLLG